MPLATSSITLEGNRNQSGTQENTSNKGVVADGTTTSMTSDGSKLDHEAEVNVVPKATSLNGRSKIHISQRLGLLPSLQLKDADSRRCSILAALPSSVNLECSITHVHFITPKRSNGMMLCQIEVVARYEPLLILSCQNTALRDTVLQHLADRSINRGRDTRVPLTVARAEEINNCGRPQWFLPIEVNDSRTETFETIERFFQKIGMIPEADLIGNKKATASKRAMITIHDASDPWLKKYAMSQEGHMKRLVSAELVHSHEECSICQEIVQQNQSLPKGFISESAGKPAKDVTPVSPKSISSLPQMSDGEAVPRPPKKHTSTALDTKNIPDKPRVQRAERKGNNVPWKIPTAHPGSLADATTVDFLELEGKQRVRAAMGDKPVKDFDRHTDANSLEPSHKEEVSAFHDNYPGVIPVSSRTNQPALEHYKHRKQEEVSFNKLPNGVTESAKSEPVGKNDQIKGQRQINIRCFDHENIAQRRRRRKL